MNTSDLLEQLLRAGQGSGASSGGLGGLLGGLLKGTSTGNASAGGGLGGLGGLLGGLGGMLGGAANGRPAQGRSSSMNYAALASLGMAAFQAYQAWQRQQANAPQQAFQTVDQLDGPAAEAHSHAVLRALIAAAKADGCIDEKEQQLISSELGRHTDDPLLKQWLEAEVAKPLDAVDFAEFASDPAVAAEVYLASVMLVDDQQDAERNYLDDLAGQLQIDPQLQLHLEQQAKA
ncbi:tellurite resistance TerB family protein [Pseudomonas sp. VS40]|uniref:tellurite resistance TerB family protein n=1 Tax=unclassified Pseudomonas TaxID=196821 RepID=UPI001BDDEF70|nr:MULTISPECIES: tellurite resistance TerB family protein [unclassified Pseudomonas]MBT1260302.1 tellurite resistance TerB family protein [Pseudomonas sp. VS40]MBT1271856.1 tellurite resistance TerB family protein [Pseudomonas sp. VS59]